MPTPPGTVYWLDCRELNYLYRTAAFEDPVQAMGAFGDHDPAHPGKTSQAIKHPQGIDWIILGGSLQERARPRSNNGGLESQNRTPPMKTKRMLRRRI